VHDLLAGASGLTALSATELARRIRDGEVSSVEVVNEHIRRIEAVNPQLNAVVVPLFDQARTEAAAADAVRASGGAMGRLHGVPVTIKECYHVKGTPSTAGLTGQMAHRADVDGPLVSRLRAAGAIVLGKTNVPQLMLYYESDNPVYGRTNNPWNLDRSPGGSSGGEGAIIAAGGSPLGLGSDIGGSIRVPAHSCGICGLKPTSGRLSTLGSADQLLLPGMEAILDQGGPLARRVEDLQLAMSVMAAPGLSEVDPSIPPVPWPDPAAVSIRGLRIGMYTDDGFFPASPALRRAVREAAAALESRGAQVELFTPPPIAEAAALYTNLMTADGADWTQSLLAGGKVDKRIKTLVMLSRLPGAVKWLAAWALSAVGQRYLATSMRTVGRRSASAYWQAVDGRKRYVARFLEAMKASRFDALICPPFMLPALTHGASELLNAVGSYPSLYNVLGMPAGVVPITRVRPGEESDRAPSGDLIIRDARKVEVGSAGLPVGLQVAARHWREDVVLAVMAELEAHFRTQPDYPVA